jgi:hypothetical protein
MLFVLSAESHLAIYQRAVVYMNHRFKTVSCSTMFLKYRAVNNDHQNSHMDENGKPFIGNTARFGTFGPLSLITLTQGQ